MAPIKPIHCVRGIVIDLSGGRISNARVTILRGGTGIVSMRANADGKFSFDRLKLGTMKFRLKQTVSRPHGLQSWLSHLRANASGRCRSF
jgi:hypothetical protein